MNTPNSLQELRRGERGQVAWVEDCPLRRRLFDLGLVSGTEVVCLGAAPAGDPTAYAFRGAVVALRGADARWVHLEEGRP